jgi:hypothetical protein
VKAILRKLFAVFATRSVMIGLLLGSSQSRLAAQNLVRNGSFEEGWEPVGLGLIGWSYHESFGVAIGGANSEFAADGEYLAMLTGPLYQDLSTIPGQNYHLRFAFAAADFNATPLSEVVNVLWEGRSPGAVTLTPVENTRLSMGWTWADFDVTAHGSRTWLMFVNPRYNEGNHWRTMTIDAVSVVAVPEPASVWLACVGAATFLLWKRLRQAA